MKFNANGTRPIHRNDFYLLSEKVLSRGEFLIYEFLVNQMGFDPKHIERYGVVEIPSFVELASFFGYSSDNSVRSKVARLIKLGLIQRIGKYTYRVSAYARSIAQTKFWEGESNDYVANEKGREPKHIFQNLGLKTQMVEDSVQLVEDKTPILPEAVEPRYLSSSKVKSNPKQVKRSRSEYEAIAKGGDFSGMSISDMEFVDGQNLV